MAFDYTSGNLIGPSLCMMQRRNAADRSPPYIHCNEEIIVNRIKNTLVSTADCSSGPVTISLSFDGTKLPRVLSLNYTYNAIVGGAYPNHWISVDGKDEEWITAKLGSDSDIVRANEVKLAVVSVQRTKLSRPCFFTLLGQPQTINMSSTFNDAVTKLVINASKETKMFDLASVCTDGVGCDNKWILEQLYNFLCGKSRYVGSVDTNHNSKNARYQVFGASSAVWIGTTIIDPELLHLAGVAHDLWQVKDFASDLLILKLASADTVEKLCSLVDEDQGCIGVICATLYFMRARLCSVNSKSVCYRDRLILMWSSMLWTTSLGYKSTYKTNQATMLANRRNIATEAIAFVFLFVREDIVNPRRCTSEPCEHTFGGWRTDRCEATLEETIWIEEKRQRKVNAIYDGGLSVSRDPKKSGYQATWANFVTSDRDSNKKSTDKMGGVAPVAFNGDNLVDSLWSHVKPIINECSNCMNVLFDKLGVDASEKSPFLRQFDSPRELASVYKDYVFKEGNEGNLYENEEDECYSTATQDMNGNGDIDDQMNRIKEFLDVTIGDTKDGGDKRNNDDTPAPDIAIATNHVDDAAEYESPSGSDIVSGWKTVIESSLEELAINCRNGMRMLSTKSKGSVNNETKRKSLMGRWLTTKKKSSADDSNCDQKFLERNVHVTLEMTERFGGKVQTSIEHYRILAVNTKSYNKWLLCDIGKHSWEKTIVRGKCRVLLHMIKFDQIMGKWQDCDVPKRIKWQKNESYFVLADASDIDDVIEKLEANG